MTTRRFVRAAPAVATLAALLALVATGCSRPAAGPSAAKAPLTEHQRDSILATEPIPGAPAVGAALKASEQASRRAAAMDSTVR